MAPVSIKYLYDERLATLPSLTRGCTKEMVEIHIEEFCVLVREKTIFTSFYRRRKDNSATKEDLEKLSKKLAKAI